MVNQQVSWEVNCYEDEVDYTAFEKNWEWVVEKLEQKR